MTEAEWLSATDPKPMLDFLRGKTTARKLRLFAVGCCVRVLPEFDHWELVEGVKQIEAVADRVLDPMTLIAVSIRAETHLYPDMPPEQVRACQAVRHAASFDESADSSSAFGVDDVETSAWPAAMRCASAVWTESCRRGEHSDFIRCVFGNPFRPVVVHRAWRTSDVLALATGIYENRAFDRMPILADALMDAGCNDGEVLHHCRQQGDHVRGCWAVDLLLGKE